MIWPIFIPDVWRWWLHWRIGKLMESGIWRRYIFIQWRITLRQVKLQIPLIQLTNIFLIALILIRNFFTRLGFTYKVLIDLFCLLRLKTLRFLNRSNSRNLYLWIWLSNNHFSRGWYLFDWVSLRNLCCCFVVMQ